MRRTRRAIGWATALLVVAGGAMLLIAWARGRPQDMPWTPLDLSQPIGLSTGRKLVALTQDFPRCRGLLDRAGVKYNILPPRHEGEHCGYDDGLRFAAGGARRLAYAPANLGMACPVAAALAVWEWDVVQPAAQRRFGQRVVTVEHFGSYNCRRIAGREAGGSWSQHATADAVDIAGFILADGTRITIARDWQGKDAAAGFLRDVRDGACDLFATTLSPDYNAAHHDHLHLDQADRGAFRWRACR